MQTTEAQRKQLADYCALMEATGNKLAPMQVAGVASVLADVEALQWALGQAEAYIARTKIETGAQIEGLQAELAAARRQIADLTDEVVARRAGWRVLKRPDLEIYHVHYSTGRAWKDYDRDIREFDTEEQAWAAIAAHVEGE